MAGNVTDEIKQRVDIVDVVSRYTPLKRAGSIYKGNCPFHNERTPSFVVFPHTGTWHCFGACATGGDVITFVMRKENLDFREAVELLAKEAGIELTPREEERDGQQRARIYAANDAAATYFEHILHNHAAAEPARRYLERRQIDAPTQQLFRLGFALDGWNHLRDYLLERGFAIELLLEAGLIKRNDERNSVFDMFRNRVIFPIRDRQGRVIGFGGRVLDDGLPKYLNTSETPVFHKSHVIYGLDLASRAIRERDQVVIVEGYMDVIAAHQYGFANVIACMGTALTPEQLRQLQHYTDNFVLALDADTAGQQATLRGLNQARQSLVRVRKPVVTPTGVQIEERLGANLTISRMPIGKDPDDVIRQDPAAWHAAVDAAKPLVDFYFDVVAGQSDLNSARGKGQVVAELSPLIAELGDEIERQHYIQRLSRLVQVDETTIAGRVAAASKTQRAELERRQQQGRVERASTDDAEALPGEERPSDSPVRAREAAAATTPRQPGRFEHEDHLLANLISDDGLLVWLAGVTERLELSALSGDDWRNLENREIFLALKRYLSSDEPWDLELFQESLPPSLHGRLADLTTYAMRSPHSSLPHLREDAIKVLVRMRIEHLKQDTSQIKFLLLEMERAGEQDAARSMFKVSNQYLRELSHLQQVMGRLPQELSRRNRAEGGLKLY
ncbi:MAG: DNA primase [Anaerolineales bacterium]|nr:DNA primase [Anaerolineales bacterium]